MATRTGMRIAINARSWFPKKHEWIHASKCVQNEEKERIGKFIFKRDAKMAMAGRLLLRYTVSRYLDVPFRSVIFGRTEKGKPYLLSSIDRTTPRYDVSFNLSHHGDYVVVAAERDFTVGVDIMKVDWPRNKAVSAFLYTMKRQLTDYEWTELQKREDEIEQLKVFYRLWCLKESLVKAIGSGIGFEVSRLEFHFGTGQLSESIFTRDTSVEIDGEADDDWSFEETLMDNHYIAVALTPKHTASSLRPSEDSVKFQVLSMDDLLSGCQPLLNSADDEDYWRQFSSREEEPGVR